MFRPSLESLEIRTIPTVQAWFGGEAVNLWSDAANGRSGIAPTTATTSLAVNDVNAGTGFGSKASRSDALSTGPTTTTVTSSLVSPIYGQSVTFTAVVSAKVGIPTGSVTFEDNGLGLRGGTVKLTTVNGHQQATYTTSLAAGSHSITAVYEPIENSKTIESSGSRAESSLVVIPANLVITPVNKTKVYGAAQPSLTASYAGFVNGDTPASLTTPPLLITTATTASRVTGIPYMITASGATDSNYAITYARGTLLVLPKPLVITPVDSTRVYGTGLPTFSATFIGFVNGDTAASLTVQPTLTTTATSFSHVAKSPYTITASGAFDSDYAISYGSGSLVITPKPLVITPVNKTKVYGAALPAFNATIIGFVNGDNAASLTVQPTMTTTATASSHIEKSPYAITASGAVDSDYAISYVSGSLVITPKPLEIIPVNLTKVYGAALPALTATYIGLVKGDSFASLTVQPALTTTATASSHVARSPYTITASGAFDSDYAISYGSGSLVITPKPLVITPVNNTKVYGAALPTFNATVIGLVNGDTGASLTVQPTMTTTATASSHIEKSPYAITASGAVDSDYAISYVSGSLVITPKPLEIIPVNLTKVYGAALPALTATYIGLVKGDSFASLTVQPALTTTATVSSHVARSPYTITASGAADSDYAISYGSGSLVITPKPLVITPVNKTKVYGAALPAFNATIIGLANGDTSASLPVQPTLTTTASASSHVGRSPYTITARGAADCDYTISYGSGSLIVTPAPLTITPDNKMQVYGAAPTILSASYSGFVNGDSPASLTSLPTLSTTATSHSHVAGNPYSITAVGAIDNDYSIRYAAGTVTITPAILTITADDKTKMFGTAIPTLTANYTGFITGDSVASLTTPPMLSTSATASSPFSNNAYPITVGGAVDADYTIKYVNGYLYVTSLLQTNLTLTTSPNSTSIYGQAVTFTATLSPTTTGGPTPTGTIQFELNGSFFGSPLKIFNGSVTSEPISSLHEGPHQITAIYSGDSNYTTFSVKQQQTITPASLIITASGQSRVYGTVPPLLTASYSGFVNGDTAASLTVQPSLMTTARANSHVGSFAIMAAGAFDPDYHIISVNGTETITAAPLTIAAMNASKVYGAALPVFTATYSGFVNGDTAASLARLPILGTTATTHSHVVGGPYVITAGGAADPDYAISYGSGSLTITPAPLTIIANNQSKLSGQPLPILTASYQGFVAGDSSSSLVTLPSLHTTALASSNTSGSSYPITASGAVIADYTIAYQPGTLTVFAGPATHYVLVGPATGRIGVAESFTVIAEDHYNNVVTSYSGTVHLTSSDSMAILPANARLTGGTGIFAVTFRTAGSNSVVATDTVNPGITGARSGITVAVAVASVPDDFDGDGKSDLAVYGKDSKTGKYRFEIVSSSTNFNPAKAITFDNNGYGFGNAQSIPVPGDYFGDGRDAYALWTPNRVGGMTFTAISSVTGKSLMLNFGGTKDIPLVADVDGDGKADFGVYGYQPGLGYGFEFLLSSKGFNTATPYVFNNNGYGFGNAQSIPVVADFDGSGKAGFGLYNPSANGATFTYVSPSAKVSFTRTIGSSKDIPLAVNFDNDGKADLALYGPDPSRAGHYRYLVLTSSSGYNPAQAVVFNNNGNARSIPVVGVYEGTNKADFALFTPDLKGGMQFVYQTSQTGAGVTIDFASAGDLPLDTPSFLLAKKVRGS